jgi:hypothetical protein
VIRYKTAASLAGGGGLCLLLGLLPTRSAVAVSLSNIRLSAERTVLRADGLSTSVLTAQVYDDRGNPAPDGTRVRFTTTAGRLDSSVVATQNGSARVTLTSSDQPSDTLVTAILDTPGIAVPANLTITFSRDADTAETGKAWARLEGDYVAYAMDYQILQANGKGGTARLTYRGLTLTADELQLNVQENSVRAGGHVVLARNGVVRHYDVLRFGLLQGQGIAQRLEDGQLHTYAVHGVSLDETAPPSGSAPAASSQWAAVDLSAAGVTVVARSIALEPGERLQFRRATFYLDGQKTVSFPFHVMMLGQKTLFEDQLIGYGPAGPSVDLPLYFDVRPSSVGTLHIRHGARLGTSAYSVRPGWNLDVAQAYNGPHSIEGTVDVYGLTRGGWNAQVRHGQRLDAQTTGSVFLDLSTLNSLFLNTQVTRSYKTFQINATGGGTRSGAVRDPVSGIVGVVSGDTHGQLNAQTYSRPLWGIPQLQYSFTSDFARQAFYGGNVSVPQGTVSSEGFGTRLFTTPLPVAHDTNLTQSVTLGRTFVQGAAALQSGIAASGPSLLGTTTLSRSLRALGSASLSYDYSQTPQILSSGITTATAGIGRQRLGLGVNLGGGERWSFSASGTRALDAAQASLYSTLGFQIVGPWRGSLVLNDNTIAGLHYRDVEYKLTRRFDSRDVSLYYSTTSKHLQFDLSSVGF